MRNYNLNNEVGGELFYCSLSLYIYAKVVNDVFLVFGFVEATTTMKKVVL